MNTTQTHLGIKVIHSLLIQLVKHFWTSRLIHLTPINVGITFTTDILHNPFISWTTTCKLTSIDSELCSNRMKRNMSHMKHIICTIYCNTNSPCHHTLHEPLYLHHWQLHV